MGRVISFLTSPCARSQALSRDLTQPIQPLRLWSPEIGACPSSSIYAMSPIFSLNQISTKVLKTEFLIS